MNLPCYVQTLRFPLVAGLILLICITACSDDTTPTDSDDEKSVITRQAAKTEKKPGCLGCHSVVLDSAHTMPCVTCHNGDPSNNQDKEIAHFQLISRPAHPDNMLQTCGKCHSKEVNDVQHSLHFTLKNSVNKTRKIFGATKDLESFQEIPVAADPKTILQLADDMLRRNCLRCHLFSPGDSYPFVRHATGCAACHLPFQDGRLVSHKFLSLPGDQQCISCHHGNRVGGDYYGQYEHDFNEEYRTPYTTKTEYFRPYGIEHHDLIPDIHQQRGMVCVDCHSGVQLMGGSQTTTLSCRSCHDAENIAKLPLDTLSIDGTSYYLTSKRGKKLHKIPLMVNKAHKKYNATVGCQVCHSQWSFRDSGIHLLRNDSDEIDAWSRLTVQGNSVVESFLTNNLDFDNEELPPVMADSITDEIRPGLWYKGYTQRRWEFPLVGRDSKGVLRILRPSLDLYLSWVDEDETTRFDSVQPILIEQRLQPYVPHTTGKAGLLYEQRILKFLQNEKKHLGSDQ